MTFTPIEITVAAEHIASGTPRMCTTCPVAIAAHGPITKAFPHATEIRVEDYALFFRTGGDDLMASSLPPEVVTFIRAYDKGIPVPPFTFTITPVAYPVTGVAA